MRGLLLRCPVCGQGKLFSSWFKMNRQCPVCGLTFEREEGYFSSAMAINLVISELIIAAVAIPLAANLSIPLTTVLLIGLPLPFLLPLIFYRHSKSLWLSMDYYLNPIRR
ncbi:MAG TPA: DUF983 domain-containing protein [Ktedonobacteraceae bacterium]|nr:DUF983 domain-containing protein [Ktedonobacteraceae bacterium]